MFVPNHATGARVRVSLNSPRFSEMVGMVYEVNEAALLLTVAASNGAHESWVVPWPTIKSIDYLDSRVQENRQIFE